MKQLEYWKKGYEYYRIGFSPENGGRDLYFVEQYRRLPRDIWEKISPYYGSPEECRAWVDGVRDGYKWNVISVNKELANERADSNCCTGRPNCYCLDGNGGHCNHRWVVHPRVARR